jgi:hypothetical protein
MANWKTDILHWMITVFPDFNLLLISSWLEFWFVMVVPKHLNCSTILKELLSIVSDLCLHAMVANGEIQCQQDGGKWTTHISLSGAMRTIPRAATKVLMGLPPQHLINEVEAQVVIYRLMCNLQLKPKFTNYGNTKYLRTWILLNGDRYDTKICIS